MIDSLKELIKSRETENIITLIEQHPDVLDQTDESGTTMLMQLAYNGLMEAFAKAKDLKISFSFHEAVVCGKHELVDEFLKNDSNLANTHSVDGFTPLSLAAFFDQTEIAFTLIDAGANPNLHATNPTKVNALHSAVAKSNIALCKRLLDAGVDVNAVQMQNVTALHSAAHRGNLELVKLLTQHGADVHLKTESGDTAISFAEKYGHDKVTAFLSSITD